ncbi:phage tail protein [Bradyrhizobium sp. USDA 3315]
MSAQKVYRFSRREHWKLCLGRGFLAGGDGLVPLRPLGPHAFPSGTTVALSTVAVDPYDNPLWRFAASPACAQAGALGWKDELGVTHGPSWIDHIIEASPRIVLDRHWLWAFEARTLRRYDRESFQSDLTVDLHELRAPDQPACIAIVDIATDGREGVWLLAATADGHALLHFDCQDCVADSPAVPDICVAPDQIGTLERGATIVLLSKQAKTLSFVETGDGTVRRHLPVEQIVPGWTALRLATDGHERVGLGGVDGDGKWQFIMLDSSGELLHPPFTDLFSHEVESDIDFALGRATVWFATDSGLWRLGDGAEEAAATTAWLITPMLTSPAGGERRGWSRAELTMDLPRGAALEVSYASTDDPNLARAVDAVSEDTDLTVARRQELIWQLLGGDEDDARKRSFTVLGPAGSEGAIAVPLFGTQDQWLWLRLRLDVPASAPPPRLTALRVLYPEISLMERLPAMFNGPKHDPAGVLRRLVGVLEATTQNIDAAIDGIGRQLDAGHAPECWLDYLGRWFDLPWHDALPADSKRRLLRSASELIAQRGTRAGLIVLLKCLVGDNAIVGVVDVTVEYQALRLGGRNQKGAAIPALLAGRSVAQSVLGRGAKLGSIRLSCQPVDCSPLGAIVPTIRISLTAPAGVTRVLAPLLPAILERFVPLGVRIAVAWHVRPAAMFETDGDILVLDGEHPGQLGENSVIGQVVLGGYRGRITNSGFETDLRLH